MSGETDAAASGCSEAAAGQLELISPATPQRGGGGGREGETGQAEEAAADCRPAMTKTPTTVPKVDVQLL